MPWPPLRVRPRRPALTRYGQGSRVLATVTTRVNTEPADPEL